MKLDVALVIVLNILHLMCHAQNKVDSVSQKIKYSLNLSAARAILDISIPASNFPTLEFRLGGGVIKPIGTLFEIKTGLTFCLKVKRESYINGSVYTQPGYPFYRINEMLSTRHHAALEMPLVLQYNILQTKAGIRGGVNVRYWLPYNSSVDLLTARAEIGWVAGGTMRITPRINAIVDFYSGITKISNGGISSSSGGVTYFYITNKYIQLSVEYRF